MCARVHVRVCARVCVRAPARPRARPPALYIGIGIGIGIGRMAYFAQNGPWERVSGLDRYMTAEWVTDGVAGLFCAK